MDYSSEVRLPFWAALLWCLALAGCGRERPSDVLLVTLDTTRTDALGCYGGALAHTPHLDALARGGARFAQAISPTPYTGPARPPRAPPIR